MSELKPCPFCGSHNEKPINHAEDCFIRMYAENVDEYYYSETLVHDRESMKAAWNTRAERTCIPHVEPRTFTGDTEPSFYQAICDCGWVVGEDGASSHSDFEHVDLYCGGCGAKIERGES